MIEIIRNNSRTVINPANISSFTGNKAVLVSGATVEMTAQEIASAESDVENYAGGGSGGNCSEMISYLEGQIADLNEQIDELEAEITSLQSDKATLNARISELNAQVLTLQAQITTLQGQISALESEKSELQTEVSDLTEQNANLNSEIEALNSQIDGMTTEITSLQDEINRLQDEVNTAYTDGYDNGYADGLAEGGADDIDDFDDQPLNTIMLAPYSKVVFTCYPTYSSSSGSKTYTCSNESGKNKWIRIADMSSYQRITYTEDGTNNTFGRGLIAIKANWSSFVSKVTNPNLTSQVKPFYDSLGLIRCDVGNLQNITGYQTQSLFGGCKNLKKFSCLGTFENCGTFSYLFDGCTKIEEIDLSNINNNKATDASGMFQSCSSLTSLTLGDFSALTNATKMFYGCTSLTSLTLGDINISSITNASNMFYGCSSLTSLTLGDFRVLTDATSMFQSCSSLTSLTLGDFSALTNATSMFQSCSSLTSLTLGDFSALTNATKMFYSCKALTSLTLVDLSALTNTTTMFQSCSSLKNLKIDQLPVSSSVTIDLTISPLNIESLAYIANTTGNGSCNLKFSLPTKALPDYQTYADILTAKGYTIS